jgi:3-methyladenine DNA glycosylase AlkD
MIQNQQKVTFQEVMQELESYGNPQTKKVLLKHGAKEPFFGVKIADMKKIVKKVKKNHELSLQLYDTGNGDAMYLAGLIADEKQITKEQLQDWAEKAKWYMVSEYTVAWVAAESPFGIELGLEWIDSKNQHIAAAGWSTLASVASITRDENLDINTYRSLLKRIEETIHDSKNRVRYTMNGFVIAIGSYIEALTEAARQTAERIGKVEVYVGDTSCKVPLATDYIQKVVDKGRVGKKRKEARC